MIDQIKAQLGRIVPVHEVHDLTVEGPSVERELALFKVAGKGDQRVEALRLADIFRANVVDSTLESFVFEITGTPEKDRRVRGPHAPAGAARKSRAPAWPPWHAARSSRPDSAQKRLVDGKPIQADYLGITLSQEA